MPVIRKSLQCLLLLAATALSACGSNVGTSATNATASAPPAATPPATPPSQSPPASAPQLTVKLSASAYAVTQSAGSVTIAVIRGGGSSGSTSVHYATSNGTAVSGMQYTATAGNVSWGNGETGNKTFSVPVNKAAFAGSKTFTVTLSAASGAKVASPSNGTVTIEGTATAIGGGGPAAKLAAKLGLPSRLLLGLGGQGATDPVTDIQTQTLKIDIYEHYLGKGDWTAWNNPPCDYVCVAANDAHSVGAIPMYTYYQMANNGDGNIAVVNDGAFMAIYWSRLKLMFQDIAALKAPALVNFEPDFWGYAERKAPSSDPAKLAAVVSTNPDCASLPDTVVGYAHCLIAMARKYAPNAYVGFPPSTWGGDSNAQVVAFMNAVGAQAADFIVEQTLDRDAGCGEVNPQPAYCIRTVTAWYWDESNQTHPNFQDHLTEAQAYHSGIGNLPILWWQTPEGVPSGTRGGSAFHYRDNRVHYFLTHPEELTAVGGLGVVFGTGENHQTNITTDGGQFQTLSGAYLSAPTPLP